MPNIPVETVPVQKADGETKPNLPVFAEIGNRLDQVRRRAYELFCSRNGEAGQELNDWLAAEREVFGSATTELSEKEDAYQLDMTLPGFEAKDIEVVATPEEIIVHAYAEHTGGETSEMYRRIEVAKPMQLDKIAAKLEEGTLHVTAPKAAAA